MTGMQALDGLETENPQGSDERAEIERPVPGAVEAAYGSDVIAEVLRELDIPYIALNPGASYRGLHDSLVNRLGNRRPQLLLCLHEEHAIGICHGYAKVTDRAMAAAIHANIGLMHASMGIFNAWCDRKPMLILGATGPVDAMKRRPMIDWQHTAADQGALVRGFTKWDDQPVSPGAARESLVRGLWLSNTAPRGPVYINLDAGLQEQRLDKPLPSLDVARFLPEVEAAPTEATLATAADWLGKARYPIILAGRASRDEAGWADRLALAEATGAGVVTSTELAASFPTGHALYRGRPWDQPAAREALAAADVILSLDWHDLAGTLRIATGSISTSAKVIHVSRDYQLHNGWSQDHQSHPPVDLMLAAEPELVVSGLLQVLSPTPEFSSCKGRPPAAALAHRPPPDAGVPSMKLVAQKLRLAVGDRPTTLTNLPTAWDTDIWPFSHPLDYLGRCGGGGLGSTLSITIGAAIALRDQGQQRLPIVVVGDGDFLFGATALWTAAHYRVPGLCVVLNNRSYFNDEAHQERVAVERGRPVENRWIGLRIADPEVDLAKLASSQGVVGLGPVTKSEDLLPVFKQAVAAVEQGRFVVIDVRVEPGETPRQAALMPRAAN